MKHLKYFMTILNGMGGISCVILFVISMFQPKMDKILTPIFLGLAAYFIINFIIMLNSDTD